MYRPPTPGFALYYFQILVLTPQNSREAFLRWFWANVAMMYKFIYLENILQYNGKTLEFHIHIFKEAFNRISAIFKARKGSPLLLPPKYRSCQQRKIYRLAYYQTDELQILATIYMIDHYTFPAKFMSEADTLKAKKRTPNQDIN